MLELILVVLVIAVLFGGVTWGPWPWPGPDSRNPLYIILAVLVVLWLLSYTGAFTGHARW